MRIELHPRGGFGRRFLNLSALATAFLLLAAATSWSQVVFDKGNGTGEPPDKLGNFELKSVTPLFPNIGSNKPSTPDFNLKLNFDGQIHHSSANEIFSAHDYTGSVYEFSGNTESIFMYPRNRRAFTFFVASATGDPIQVQVEARGSSESALSDQVTIEGKNTALFFGFYTEGTEVLHQIKVSVANNASVLIGEFQVNSSQ